MGGRLRVLDLLRFLTGSCSSRWAESITKASHDQWALARRGQAAHLASLDAAITMISHLSIPVGENGRGRGDGPTDGGRSGGVADRSSNSPVRT